MRWVRIVAVGWVLGLAGPAFAEGDPAAGEQIFRKCAACHNVKEAKNKVGPHLVGLWGRKAGTLEGFKYSDGMIAYGEGGVVWGDETLMTYLEDPRGLVKGTKMAFAGVKPEQERADVIAYLKQFSQ
jgi:cytochrome c